MLITSQLSEYSHVKFINLSFYIPLKTKNLRVVIVSPQVVVFGHYSMLKFTPCLTHLVPVPTQRAA